MSDNIVGDLHWSACEKCNYYDSDKGGCGLAIPEISIHLGDFVVCDDYEEKAK